MDAAVAATSEIENESTFNRKPSPKGEDMAESVSANQRNISRSMSAKKSPKQASRISQ